MCIKINFKNKYVPSSFNDNQSNVPSKLVELIKQ